jgi:hypothetical protein
MPSEAFFLCIQRHGDCLYETVVTVVVVELVDVAVDVVVVELVDVVVVVLPT